VISATSITNPQLVEHLVLAYGFILPTYTTSQNTGCPCTSWNPSANAGPLYAAYVKHGGVNELVNENGNDIIKATDNALHMGYKFYMRVVADGVNSYTDPIGTVKYFEMYELKVGCYPDSLIVTESPQFVSNFKLFIGDSVEGLYTLTHPTSNLAYCQVLKNLITDENGSLWSKTVQV
jgi:hypothetical protein